MERWSQIRGTSDTLILITTHLLKTSEYVQETNLRKQDVAAIEAVEGGTVEVLCSTMSSNSSIRLLHIDDLDPITPTPWHPSAWGGVIVDDTTRTRWCKWNSKQVDMCTILTNLWNARRAELSPARGIPSSVGLDLGDVYYPSTPMRKVLAQRQQLLSPPSRTEARSDPIRLLSTKAVSSMMKVR